MIVQDQPAVNTILVLMVEFGAFLDTCKGHTRGEGLKVTVMLLAHVWLPESGYLMARAEILTGARSSV